MSILWNLVDLTSYYNIIGIIADGESYGNSSNVGLDGTPGDGGSTLSGNAMENPITWDTIPFPIGPEDNPDMVECTGQSITLLQIPTTQLRYLGFSTNGPFTQRLDLFTTDSADAAFFQGMSDWADPQGYDGEQSVFTMSYRNRGDGGHDFNTFHIYGYTIEVDPSRTPSSLLLHSQPQDFILALAQVDDTGSDITVSGSGVTNAVYNIVGSGTINIHGDQVSSFIDIDTESGEDLLAEDGRFLVCEGGGFAEFVSVSVSHNVVGSGSIVIGGNGQSSVHGGGDFVGSGFIFVSGSGTSRFVGHDVGSGLVSVGGAGVSSVTEFSNNMYSEVGSGTITLTSQSVVSQVLGPVSQLASDCHTKTLTYVECNGAYVPMITRCNQQLIKILLSKICKQR